jgi:Arm DNA-binding domain
MPSAKSPPVKRRKKIGSWGGRRKGAGRKPKLTLSSRQKIAREYLDHMLEPREFGDTPRRDALIRKLMAKYNVTHRMVVRCLDEWLPTRWNRKMYRSATEGAPIQPLPGEKIQKLSPGIYEDKSLPLRLIIDSAGSRKWIFRFIWRCTGHEMTLGGSELSLATARELATKASRKLAAGQNPIDDSWSSTALQSLRSKS